MRNAESMSHTINKRYVLLITIVFASAAFGFASDFGLVLASEGEYVSDADGKGPGFTGSLTPWLSAAFGETLSLYLSGKLSFQRQYETKAAPPLVELERTELSFRPLPEVYLSLGRQFYRDGAGMIASGLFDGLAGAFSFGWGRVSVGGFYTGFLYKETAGIIMTGEDRARYDMDMDYAGMDTYFASRRVIVPIGVEFPDLVSRLSLSLTGIAQIDLNKESSALHTQYAEAQLGIEVLDSLRLSLTGIGERIAPKEADALGGFAAAFALDWDMPGNLTDMLSFELRWGSGVSGERAGAFLPVSGIAQGVLFSETLSGIMNARALYSLRPHESFSLSLGTVLFWRTDLETFKASGLNGASKDRFLGAELYGALIWSVDSALRLTAGGGAFFPGGAFTEEADPEWEVRAGVVLSL
jgi:hypothetical protein